MGHLVAAQVLDAEFVFEAGGHAAESLQGHGVVAEALAPPAYEFIAVEERAEREAVLHENQARCA